MKRKRDPIVRQREKEMRKKQNKWHSRTPTLPETTDVRPLLVLQDAIPFVTDEMRIGWFRQELCRSIALRDYVMTQLPMEFIREQVQDLGVQQYTIQQSEDKALLNIGRLRWLQNKRKFLDERCEAFRTLELLQAWGFSKIGELTKWKIPMREQVFKFNKISSTAIYLRNVDLYDHVRPGMRIVRFLQWYEMLSKLLDVHMAKLVIEYAYDFKTEMVRRLLK